MKYLLHYSVFKLRNQIMKKKIFIEMREFIEQHARICDDAFKLNLMKNLRTTLFNLSNKYKIILLTTHNLGESKKWLKKYRLNQFFSEYYNFELEKMLEDDNSIPYYVVSMSLIELHH